MMSSLIRKLYLFNAKFESEKKKKKQDTKKSEKKNDGDKSGGDDKRAGTRLGGEETNKLITR